MSELLFQLIEQVKKNDETGGESSPTGYILNKIGRVTTNKITQEPLAKLSHDGLKHVLSLPYI